MRHFYLILVFLSVLVPITSYSQVTDDNVSTDEDTPVNFSVTDNDIVTDLDVGSVDLDRNTVGRQIFLDIPGNGELAVDDLGNVTFTPDLNWFGVVNAEYEVSDINAVVAGSAFMNITVTSINDAPLAGNDVAVTNEDIPVTILVQDNDGDVDGTLDGSSIDVDDSQGGIQTTLTTADGTWEVISGEVQFTPAPDYSGVTSIQYTIDDNDGGTSNAATIQVTVNIVNDAPVANDDTGNTTVDVNVNISILANDTDDSGIAPGTVDLDPSSPGRQNSFNVTEGNFSVSNAGVLTFNPAGTFIGTVAINYTVQDINAAVSNQATVTITVLAIPPVAVDDAKSTNEDASVNVNAVQNDTDADGSIDKATVDLDIATPGIQNTKSTTEGNYSAQSNGNVMFTPAANFNGIATVQYVVNDDEGNTSNVATITITVNSVNDLPVANDDATSTNEETLVTLDVVQNDTDVDGSINPLTVDLNTSSGGIQNTRTTASGTYSVDNSGVVTFTPAANFSGVATLQYVVNDNGGAISNAATITITVDAVNDIPVANNDATSTNEETDVTLNVVQNDTDVDGSINPLTVDLNPSSAGIQNTRSIPSGTFAVDNSGVVTFTPAVNFSGVTAIQYVVNDNGGATSNAATITITVNSVNDLPIANDDATSTNEETPVTLDVVQNDTDIDGSINPLTVDLNTSSGGIQNTRSTTSGTYSVDNSGVVTFTPAASFNGIATLQYTVNDNGGSTSNIATITVTVNSINDNPVANGDATSTNEDTSVALNVVQNDTDDGSINATTVDLDIVAGGIQITKSTANGSYSVDNNGLVTYTPVANFNGVATLQYTVNDNSGLTSNSATITITVNSINDLPVANNDATSTNEETLVTLNVVQNDSDPDGTINAATVDLNTTTGGIQNTRTTSDGVYSVDNAGVITFTPAANFSGVATLQYVVNDNGGATSNAATISITVDALNDSPVANNDATSTNEDTAVTLNVVQNDTDADGTINAATVDLNTATVGIQNTRSTASGAYSVDNNGVVTFTPVANFSGAATLQYVVNDNGGATSNAATITITVNTVNDSPVANNDAASTNEETAVTLNVVQNDTDPDGTINVATVDLNTTTGGIQNTRTTSDGVYSVDNSGVVTFTPASNFSGVATLQYAVNDNGGATSNAATISITVNGLNDNPVANGDATSTNEETAVTLNVVQNDTDSDGTINASSVDLDIATPGIQTTRSTSNGNYSASNGSVTYTPVANFYGIATLQYVVNDNSGATSNAATITITVNSLNDNPVATADATSTNQNQGVTLNVIANDTDDGFIDPTGVDLNMTTAGIQNTFTATGGTFTVNNSGIVTFSPTAGFSGVVTINYTVRDNEGATSNQASITITVIRVNEKPVAVNDVATTNEDTQVSINVLTNDTDDISLNVATVDLDVNTGGIQNTRTVAGGSFSVNSVGLVTFTPTANFSGSVNIRYSVNDNEGATSDPGNITITVNPVNDAPVATNDTKTVNEDSNAVVNILANDHDDDGTLVASSVDLDPGTSGQQSSISVAGGTFAVDASGVLTFTPTANSFGNAVATYTVNDNSGNASNVGTITITITSVNDVPVATNDIESTPQNVPITFNILANDIDADGTINGASIDLDLSAPGFQNTRTIASGTFSVNNTGDLTFSPLLNFNGTSSITYTVQDNSGATSNTGSISVLVSFVNQAPVAVNDNTSTNEDTPVNLNVIANDTDDGSISAATVDLNQVNPGIQNSFTNAAGTFAVNSSGVLTFTPTLNTNGTATCNYTVNDNLGQISNVATITITINPINDPPVAGDDVASGPEDQPLLIDVLDNDNDVDNALEPATIDLVPGTAAIDNTYTTAQGTFTNNTSTGVVTFVPEASFFGAVNITYKVKDATGAISNLASIKVTIINVNDLPSFDVIQDQRVFRNSNTKAITITGISAGPNESEVITMSATSGNPGLIPNPDPPTGTGTTRTLSFKPQVNQSGTAEITVKAVDEGLKEFSRTFTIVVVDARIISDPVTVAIVGEPYNYEIKTTDITETLSLVGVQIPTWATFTITGKNTAMLSGTPPANAVSSNVTIQLKNGNEILDVQTFTILIKKNPSGTSFDLLTNEDVGIVISSNHFAVGYSDPDNDPFTRVIFTTAPKHGSISLGSTAVDAGDTVQTTAMANLIYTPALNYSGKDTVYFKVGDQFSFSSAANFIQFIISPVNDPPTITNIETEPLFFDIGTEIPQIITPAFDAEDPDSEFIQSAEVGFQQPEYNKNHDVIIFKNTSKISGDYDDDTGILMLNGEATVQEYVDAIRTIQYNFEIPDEIIETPRTVYFRLSDGTATSEQKQRTIDLHFEFVELKIPNVFTPDGNESHEVWPFTSDAGVEQYTEAVIRVFTERGKLVHEGIGFSTPWDGKQGGKDVPAGTYFYTIDLKYGRIRYNGSVTILRITEK